MWTISRANFITNVGDPDVEKLANAIQASIKADHKYSINCWMTQKHVEFILQNIKIILPPFQMIVFYQKIFLPQFLRKEPQIKVNELSESTHRKHF